MRLPLRSISLAAAIASFTVSTSPRTFGIAEAMAQTYPAGPAIYAAGDDIVHLTGGGMLRGTILEILPNDHVTLQLANGQTATIEWSHVARIEQRGQSTQTPAPTPAPGAAPPPPSTRGTAVVHIESDRPVRLEMQPSKGVWQFVCASPCDREVDLAGNYRIAGDGVRSSRVFQIEGRAGERVVLEVDTSSKAAFAGGIVLTSTMPIVSLVGAVVWATAGTSSNQGTVGAGLTIGGLVGLTIGIVMIASNASTKETQSSEPARRTTVAEPALFRF